MQIDDSEADNMAAESGAEAPVEPTRDRTAATAAASEHRGRRSRQDARTERVPDPEAQERKRGDEPSGVVHRRGGRVLSEEVRALQKTMQADLGEQIRNGVGVGEFDDLDIRYEEKARAAPGDRDTPEPPAKPTGKAAEPAAAPQEAPAPSLDPVVLDRARELDEREQSLLARESELADREASSDVGRLYDGYAEQPARTVLDLVRRSTGLPDGPQLMQEISDLVTTISHEILGVDVPPQVLNALTEKRTRAMVRNHEKRLSAREVEIERKRLETEQAAFRSRAVSELQSTVMRNEYRAKFPYLSRDPRAGEYIADVLETQLRRDGANAKPMNWEDAAQRANDWLAKRAKETYEAHKDLFEAAGRGGKPSNRNDVAGIQSSRTLSNAVTSQPSGAPRGDEEGEGSDRRTRWTQQGSRRDLIRQYRQAFRQGGD